MFGFGSSSFALATSMVISSTILLIAFGKSISTPRIKSVVAGTVSNVGDSGKHFAIKADAGDLNGQVVKTADGVGRLDPVG